MKNEQFTAALSHVSSLSGGQPDRSCPRSFNDANDYGREQCISTLVNVWSTHESVVGHVFRRQERVKTDGSG
jgi:hypothetical protein